MNVPYANRRSIIHILVSRTYTKKINEAYLFSPGIHHKVDQSHLRTIHPLAEIQQSDLQAAAAGWGCRVSSSNNPGFVDQTDLCSGKLPIGVIEQAAELDTGHGSLCDVVKAGHL